MSKDIVRFALIGCGAISRKYVSVFESLRSGMLVAVSDCDEVKAAAVAQKTGADWVIDYRRLLDRKDIDVVIIAVPSGLHAQIAIEAFGAGEHVIVEKPLAMSLQQADAMIQTAEDHQRFLSVVHHHRFSPASQVLKRALDEGEFGQIHWASTSVKWYRPQSYYESSGWRGTLSMDGGVLLNQAIHHIDLLLWYAGEVAEFQAMRSRLVHQMEAEDVAAAVLRFKNGALGTIDATTCAYPQNLEQTVTILGERGSAIMGGSQLNDFRSWTTDLRSLDQIGSLVAKEIIPWFGHYKVVEDMVVSVQDNRKPLIDGIEARKSLSLILGIYKSTAIRE